MGETALIVGAGSGLSASLARLFSKNDMKLMNKIMCRINITSYLYTGFGFI